MISYKKTCTSKSFLNFRLFSTRLLIKWFPVKERVVAKVFYILGCLVLVAYKVVSYKNNVYA